MAKSGLDPQAPPPWEQTGTQYKRICEALLEPTRLYVKPLLGVLKKGLVKAAAHITGGKLATVSADKLIYFQAESQETFPESSET